MDNPQIFSWNEFGVCENPMVYSFDQGRRFQCRISVARFSGVHYFGHTFQQEHMYRGNAAPCARTGNPCGSGTNAVIEGLWEAISFFEKGVGTHKYVTYLEKHINQLKAGMPLPEPTQESIMQKTVIEADANDLPLEVVNAGGPETTTPSIAAVARAAAVSPLDKESSGRISRAYKKAISGLRDVVICGVEMLEQKANLKHGQFLPWLEKNCPEIPERTARQFMACAESAICLALDSKSYSQIGNDCRFDNMPIAMVLQLPYAELQPAAAAAQKQIFELVDGKTQKQLLFDFRDTERKPRGGDVTPKDASGKPIRADRRRQAQIEYDAWKIAADARNARLKTDIDDALADPITGPEGTIRCWQLLDTKALKALAEAVDDFAIALAHTLNTRAVLAGKK